MVSIPTCLGRNPDFGNGPFWCPHWPSRFSSGPLVWSSLEDAGFLRFCRALVVPRLTGGEALCFARFSVTPAVVIRNSWSTTRGPKWGHTCSVSGGDVYSELCTQNPSIGHFKVWSSLFPFRLYSRSPSSPSSFLSPIPFLFSHPVPPPLPLLPFLPASFSFSFFLSFCFSVPPFPSSLPLHSLSWLLIFRLALSLCIACDAWHAALRCHFKTSIIRIISHTWQEKQYRLDSIHIPRRKYVRWFSIQEELFWVPWLESSHLIWSRWPVR